MNYKFNPQVPRFDLHNFFDEELIKFFSLNKFKVANFFEGKEFVGWLSLGSFLKNKAIFSEDLLEKDHIENFTDYITDHKKLMNFFNSHKKIHSVIVSSCNNIIGEFEVIGNHRYSFEVQRKLDTLTLLKYYEKELKNFFENQSICSIGIIVPETHRKFIPDFMDVCKLGEKEKYDIIIEGFWLNEFCDLYPDVVSVDDILSCALLFKLSKQKGFAENLYFIDEPDLSAYNLYDDELEMLSYVKNLSLALEKHDFIEKAYKGYPQDKDYVEFLGKDVYHSVIVSNNGVYRYVSQSKLKDDFDGYRITPSNKGYADKVFFYGPCVCYSIFTSRFSSIEEFIQQHFNENGVQYDAVNCGIPNGGNFINDLIRLIYNDYTHCSYHIFINRFGKFISNYLKNIGANYISMTPMFKGEHYCFFNENMHLTPKGTKLMAKFLFSHIDFNKNSEFGTLEYLRRKVPDKRYYLIENDVENFKDYLRMNKTEKKGTIGFVHVNASPMTNGHAYLIDYATHNCDFLYVFVVEDNPNALPFFDRYNMVKEFCTSYSNVKVLSSSDFLGSKYTLTAYFNKQYDMEITPEKDVENFNDIIMPILEIDVRFMGSEPNSELTNKINKAYKKYMKSIGKKLIEIPRISVEGVPISASIVRKYLKERDFQNIKKLVPNHVYRYLQQTDISEVTGG